MAETRKPKIKPNRLSQKKVAAWRMPAATAWARLPANGNRSVAEERRNKMADEIGEREDGAAIQRDFGAFAERVAFAQRCGKVSDGKERAERKEQRYERRPKNRQGQHEREDWNEGSDGVGAAHCKRRPQQIRIVGFTRIDAELVPHHLVKIDFRVLGQAPDYHLRFFRAEAFEFIVRHLLRELALRIALHLALFHVDRSLHDLALGLAPQILPDAHRKRARQQRAKPAAKDGPTIALGDSDPGDDPERGEYAVLDSENDFANAAALLEGTALQRVWDARLDLLPTRHVFDDALDRRRQIRCVARLRHEQSLTACASKSSPWPDHYRRWPPLAACFPRRF